MAIRGDASVERGIETYEQRRVNRTVSSLDRRAKLFGCQLVKVVEDADVKNSTKSVAQRDLAQGKDMHLVPFDTIGGMRAVDQVDVDQLAVPNNVNCVADLTAVAIARGQGLAQAVEVADVSSTVR